MLTRIEALLMHQGHGAAIAQFGRQGNSYIPDILVQMEGSKYTYYQFPMPP